MDVFAHSQLSDVSAPGIHYALADSRFRNVVENKSMLRMTIHKLNRCRQVSLKNQDVVNQTGVLETRDAAVESRIENKVVIRFALNDVAKPLELAMGLK